MSTRRGTSHGSASTSTRAPPCSGTLDAGAGPSSGGSLEEGRAKWIQDRQEELDRVFDRHDSLIREAFHLEKFVSLLSYDPKGTAPGHSPKRYRCGSTSCRASQGTQRHDRCRVYALVTQT
ncbi:hypothetical protein BD309DRAFT_509317 [Dichomitus squalens]|nr:hypothetical protein BD309DRAFT_509317 [Dichomitus squalens]